jgi:rhodanese-related sulfurtransferase
MPITPVADLVAAAKAEITTLSPEEARARVDAGAALLVDIRDVRELNRDGRVPGALHAPRGMLEFWVDPASPYHKTVLATDKTLILFCAAASRSALAAQTLQRMGVENVAEMAGGFRAWKDSGAPVDTTGG